MNSRGTGDTSSQTNASRQQAAITAQLFKAVTNMHHIDQLFLWLSSVIIERFGIQVFQFWAVESSLSGQFSLQIRTLSCEDTSFPQHIFASNQFAVLAQRIIRQQNIYAFYTVSNILPPYQTDLLGRYGLNYCASYFLRSSKRLPPSEKSLATGKIPTPLVGTLLLFLRQPLSPYVLTAIGSILEQTIVIAESRGLLLPTLTPPSGSVPRVSTVPPSQRSKSDLSELIPHRTEDTELMRSSNPLSGSIIISDKQARRLYAGIDDHRNVDELCNITSLDIKEVFFVLQKLLLQHRIQLFDAEGQLVDTSLFFKDRA